MLLSREKILEHITEGTIVIDPFDDRKLKTASYDVSLGEWYWRERHPAGISAGAPDRSATHNVYDEESARFIWEGPFRAEPVGEVEERMGGRRFWNVPRHAKVILLMSGETVLGHTEEFIGGRGNCVAKMHARSSLGRNFIEVCKNSGWGNVGYINRWTMEITNKSRFFSVPLVVGRRVGQVVFYEVAPVGDADYVRDGGKYQHSQDLEVLKRSWSPEMMIPKMHLDWEIGDGK